MDDSFLQQPWFAMNKFYPKSNHITSNSYIARRNLQFAGFCSMFYHAFLFFLWIFILYCKRCYLFYFICSCICKRYYAWNTIYYMVFIQCLLCVLLLVISFVFSLTNLEIHTKTCLLKFPCKRMGTDKFTECMIHNAWSRIQYHKCIQ